MHRYIINPTAPLRDLSRSAAPAATLAAVVDDFPVDELNRQCEDLRVDSATFQDRAHAVRR